MGYSSVKTISVAIFGQKSKYPLSKAGIPQHGQVHMKLTTVYFRGALIVLRWSGLDSESSLTQGSVVQGTIKPLVQNRTSRKLIGAGPP